jgi:cytidylate kinase
MDRPVTTPRGIIELVGPAGVGKTSIRRLLAAKYGLSGRGVWRMPSPRLFRSAIRLLPTSLQLWARAGTVAWEETKHIIRLDALFHLLHGPNGRVTRRWILDEGPVFVFAWLRAMGCEAARPERFADWWGPALTRWRRAVDVIVTLDASNEILTERIRAREKVHLVKTTSDAAAAEFLDRYRAAYAATIADFTVGDSLGPEVVRVRTDAQVPEMIVEDLARRLNGKLHAR